MHSSIRNNIVENIDWNDFRDYVFQKYAKSWAHTVYAYARKYAHLINNPSRIDTFTPSKKNAVLKSLTAFAKYCGFFEEFQKKIKNYGIAYSRSSCIDAFLRILSSDNKDVIAWYNKASSISDEDLKTYLKFMLLSGLRASEGIESFNLIRTKLNEYYNPELGTLEHFRFKEKFLRGTKNAFVTIIPESFIMEITEKDEVTYPMIVKKLQRKKLPVRLNELRDYYGTFMVRHGLIKEEVDLLQGRISKSIFVRHYWSPSFKELRERTLIALEQLEALL